MGKVVSTGAIPFPTTATDWTRWGLGALILGVMYYAFGVQVAEAGGGCLLYTSDAADE